MPVPFPGIRNKWAFFSRMVEYLNLAEKQESEFLENGIIVQYSDELDEWFIFKYLKFNIKYFWHGSGISAGANLP